MQQFYKGAGGEVEAVKLAERPDVTELTEAGERAGVGDYRIYDVTRRQWHYMSKAGFEALYPTVSRMVKSAAELEAEAKAKAKA